MFPCTQNKGLPKFRYVEDPANDKKFLNKEARCCCFEFDISRGGRLKCFMLYDLLITLVCIIGFVSFTFALDRKVHEYQIKETIFYFKSIYGLLSFPFLIFNIPFMDLLLTKSRPTGYTEQGQCIPKIKTLYLRDPKEQPF